MTDLELREMLEGLASRLDDKLDSRLGGLRDEVKLVRTEVRDLRTEVGDLGGAVQRLDVKLDGFNVELHAKIDHLRDTIAGHFDVLEVRLDERYVRKA